MVQLGDRAADGTSRFPAPVAKPLEAVQDLFERNIHRAPRGAADAGASPRMSAMGPDDGHGLSAVRITRQIEGSLERLGTDRLDMYLTHEPDPHTPLEETLQAFTALTNAGKVRFFGASNIGGPQLEEALSISGRDNVGCFAWVQNNYSLLERSQETAVLPICTRQKLGFTPFSPLAGGWLTGKYDSTNKYPEGSRMTLRPEPYRHIERASTYTGLDRLCETARERGVSMAALSMAWVLAHPAVTAIVIGPRRPSQLADAAAALQIEMDQKARGELADLFES